MFAAVIVYFQTTGLTILDNGGPLLQSDIVCYSLNIVHRKPPEFKKCEKLRKFFNCTQLSQKSEALRRTLVVYHLQAYAEMRVLKLSNYHRMLIYKKISTVFVLPQVCSIFTTFFPNFQSMFSSDPLMAKPFYHFRLDILEIESYILSALFEYI